MTIIYQYRVATTSLGGFLKLLAAWRGSVYKLIAKEMFIFATLYAAISLLYRLVLTEPQKREMMITYTHFGMKEWHVLGNHVWRKFNLVFEKIVIHCDSFTSLIPISFVLGFYVTLVVGRWWQQFMNVPWPDRTLFIMTTYITGQDDRSRIIRRTIARYMLFGLIVIMRSVSVAVKKRFPTVDHIVEAGFITKDESLEFEETQCQYNKFWVPLMWANGVLVQARKEGKIDSEFGLRMVIEQLATFRDKCSLCFVYDWITIPLVYTQVVTLAVHMFFATCILGRQFLDPNQHYPGNEYDFYIPIFTFLQFFFYMGWLKVAEQLINPFGEDDDDFDINWLLDRHTAVALTLVDQCCNKHPPLVKDHFWNDVVLPDLPYTEASKHSKRPNFLGSTFNITTDAEDQRMFVPELNARRRSRGSMTSGFTGSFVSLIKHGSLYDSRDTLPSIFSQDRGLSVPNGRVGYLQVPSVVVEHPAGRASCDLGEVSGSLDRLRNEGRSRSNTDADDRLLTPKTKAKRKLSTPFNFKFFSRKENKKPTEPVPSPKVARFTIEPVPDDEQEHVPRKRRSGHILHVLEKQSISRPPLLSAIEEGNTVTSVRQLITESPESSENEDVFKDESGPEYQGSSQSSCKPSGHTIAGQATDKLNSSLGTANKQDTELTDLDSRSESTSTSGIPLIVVDEW